VATSRDRTNDRTRAQRQLQRPDQREHREKRRVAPTSDEASTKGSESAPSIFQLRNSSMMRDWSPEIFARAGKARVAISVWSPNGTSGLATSFVIALSHPIARRARTFFYAQHFPRVYIARSQLHSGLVPQRQRAFDSESRPYYDLLKRGPAGKGML